MYFFPRDEVSEIVTVLKDDGLILAPTDTIWGIHCDATNAFAVERVNLLKNSFGKGYIILVPNIEELKKYTDSIHPKIETLLEFHKRPLSIIFPKGINLPENILGPGGSIGIRICKEPIFLAIFEELGKPLLSTSPNILDAPIPQTFGGIRSDVFSKMDYVVKQRQAEKTEQFPSAVVMYNEENELEFIRE
jgi:L-threonylcarbamoyladenylate synthase